LAETPLSYADMKDRQRVAARTKRGKDADIFRLETK